MHLSVGQQSGQCQYVVVNCPNDDCDMSYPRNELKTHTNKECDYCPFTCPFAAIKMYLYLSLSNITFLNALIMIIHLLVLISKCTKKYDQKESVTETFRCLSQCKCLVLSVKLDAKQKGSSVI